MVTIKPVLERKQSTHNRDNVILPYIFTIVIQLGGGAFKQIIDQTQLDQIKATVSMDTTTTFAKKTEIKEPIRQERIS